MKVTCLALNVTTMAWPELEPRPSKFNAPTSRQAFSQDSKSGRPKCAIGPAQINNL